MKTEQLEIFMLNGLHNPDKFISMIQQFDEIYQRVATLLLEGSFNCLNDDEQLIFSYVKIFDIPDVPSQPEWGVLIPSNCRGIITSLASIMRARRKIQEIAKDKVLEGDLRYIRFLPTSKDVQDARLTKEVATRIWVRRTQEIE